jgi:hypothetical protein
MTVDLHSVTGSATDTEGKPDALSAKLVSTEDIYDAH